MKSRVVRSLFVDRATRLGFSFLLSFASSLVLASVFPIWLLVLGPLVLGIPHLFAGARYLPTILGTPTRRLRSVAVGIIVGVAILRSLPGAGGFAFWDVLAGVFFLAWLGSSRLVGGKGDLPAVTSVALLLVTAAATWLYPLLTIGLVAFFHNFVAFLFWLRAANGRREKMVASGALVAFVVGTALCLTDVLDFMVGWGAGVADPQSRWLSPLTLTLQIFPLGQDPAWSLKILRAFAFGQALHYFVWLKAIPEETLSHGTPLSFRQSWAALRRELGRPVAYAAVVASLGILASLAIFPLATVRAFYLSLAASHGYLEFAALPFLFSRERHA